MAAAVGSGASQQADGSLIQKGPGQGMDYRSNYTASAVPQPLADFAWGETEQPELLNAVEAAVYTTDAEGRITFYNEAAARLWGQRPELGTSEFCGSWKLYWPDGSPLPHDQCPMAVALRERRPVRNMEAIAERPDGTRVPFVPFPTPLYDSSGAFVGAVNVLLDITERKRAESALALKVKEQTALYHLTDRLYRAVSLDEVYDAALQAITDALGCERASILLFDDTGVMRFAAWRGLSETYRKAVEGHSPWRQSLHEAQPICVSDVNASQELAHLRQTIGAEGIRALCFVPILINGGVAGKFMTYYDAPHEFSTHETELSLSIARQIGFSIQSSRAENSSRLLAAVVDCSDDAILAKNLDGIITSWNRGAQRLYGYTADEAIGKPVSMLIPEDRFNEESNILKRIRSGERIDHYETVRRRKNGSLIDISLTVSPIRNASGTIIGASKIARDISERRRAQEQQQLLLREMNHRIKNLFALATSVVSLSARSARSAGELASTVCERLGALARAHSLAVAKPSADEVGAVLPTSLHALIRTVLLPYDDKDGRRITISGPDFMVSGAAITHCALLFNEFATNAAKYGSLSVPNGTVDILCTDQAEVLHMKWVERGGPPVQVPTAGDGFGSRLTEATVKGQLAGYISREWKEEGLVISLALQRSRLTS
jgi:PAS domain S-box-containing protein